MSDMLDRRLLSPMRRRLYPNARTGTGISTAGNVVQSQREGLKPGQADDVTWNTLAKMGWVEYTGPAQTDERGYIIPGTDPAIVPTPWDRSEGKK